MRGQFMKGIIVGTLISSIVMVAGTAMAGTGIGAALNLGKWNKVNRTTTLTGKTSSKILKLGNTGSGSALSLSVKPGKAPLTVSSAGLVPRLNADKVDGMHAADIGAAHTTGGRVTYPVAQTTDVCTLPGFGVIEATPDGGGTLRLRCTGTVENAKVTYDPGDYWGMASGMDTKTSGSVIRVDMLWNGTQTATVFTESTQTGDGTPMNLVTAMVQ